MVVELSSTLSIDGAEIAGSSGGCLIVNQLVFVLDRSCFRREFGNFAAVFMAYVPRSFIFLRSYCSFHWSPSFYGVSLALLQLRFEHFNLSICLFQYQFFLKVSIFQQIKLFVKFVILVVLRGLRPFMFLLPQLCFKSCQPTFHFEQLSILRL